VNDGSPHTPPISTVQSAAGRVVADTVSTVSTAARRMFDSGSKVIRGNKNRDSLDTVQQDSVPAVQQDDTSTTIHKTIHPRQFNKTLRP